MSNKIKYNLCNVHFAPLSLDAEGKETFTKIYGLPGAVSLSMDPNGEPEPFYADGVAYYVVNNSMGYDGSIELAMITQEFLTLALSQTEDTNGVLVENTADQLTPFALLFEFDGDVKKIRHVLYNCTASRPTIASSTNTEKKEVQTEKLNLKARPLSDGVVKAKTGDATTDAVYNAWYTTVYRPVPKTTTTATTESGS